MERYFETSEIAQQKLCDRIVSSAFIQTLIAAEIDVAGVAKSFGCARFH